MPASLRLPRVRGTGCGGVAGGRTAGSCPVRWRSWLASPPSAYRTGHLSCARPPVLPVFPTTSGRGSRSRSPSPPRCLHGGYPARQECSATRWPFAFPCQAHRASRMSAAVRHNSLHSRQLAGSCPIRCPPDCPPPLSTPPSRTRRARAMARSPAPARRAQGAAGLAGLDGPSLRADSRPPLS
jgi:hypothetical protein